LLTDFVFDDVAEVAKGYIAVRTGDNWGFVDASGREVIPFVFANALNIDTETAFVNYNGKYGILDVQRTVVALPG